VDAKVFYPLTLNEKILLGIITILVIAGGIYPKPLLDIAEPSLKVILERSGAALMR
jgi:NADH:ubiquinone oxidoreductase subunit 4 (subunit M)